MGKDNKFLWHSTRLELLEKIKTRGLKAGVPEQRPKKIKGVYLSDYMFGWTYYASLMGKIPGLILKINIENLNIIPDYHDKQDVVSLSGEIIGNDFICLDNILANQIMEFWEEHKQNSFRKIEI